MGEGLSFSTQGWLRKWLLEEGTPSKVVSPWSGPALVRLVEVDAGKEQPHCRVGAANYLQQFRHSLSYFQELLHILTSKTVPIETVVITRCENSSRQSKKICSLLEIYSIESSIQYYVEDFSGSSEEKAVLVAKLYSPGLIS